MLPQDMECTLRSSSPRQDGIGSAAHFRTVQVWISSTGIKNSEDNKES